MVLVRSGLRISTVPEGWGTKEMEVGEVRKEELGGNYDDNQQWQLTKGLK